MVPCGARAHAPFCPTAPLPLQGHILAASAIGDIYYWGKGVAIDYPRAMAAYKIAAEAGDALSQYQVGIMYCKGLGVAVDYKQARPWLEKAAAQDLPNAVGQLGYMYSNGKGVAPSWRRARELYERAIELGNLVAVDNLQTLTESIAVVTRSGKPPHTTPLHVLRSCQYPRSHTPSRLAGRPPHGQAGGDPRHEPRRHQRQARRRHRLPPNGRTR